MAGSAVKVLDFMLRLICAKRLVGWATSARSIFSLVALGSVTVSGIAALETIAFAPIPRDAAATALFLPFEVRPGENTA